jgi:hypothetical protein
MKVILLLLKRNSKFLNLWDSLKVLFCDSQAQRVFSYFQWEVKNMSLSYSFAILSVSPYFPTLLPIFWYAVFIHFLSWAACCWAFKTVQVLFLVSVCLVPTLLLRTCKGYFLFWVEHSKLSSPSTYFHDVILESDLHRWHEISILIFLIDFFERYALQS